MNSYLTGKLGEEIAAKYLVKKGYKLTDASFRSRYGEIDLVVRKGRTVVFVEVKTRKNKGFAAAFENVDRHKIEKIKKTAAAWMEKYDQNFNYRFDVIEVYTENMTVNHIENAFQ